MRVLSTAADEPRELLDELLSDARARGSPLGYVYTSAIRCMAAMRQGEVKEALADGAASTEVAEAHGIRLQLGLVFAPYMDALVASGEPRQALACAERYFELDDQRDVSSHAFLLHNRGQAYLANGEIDAALADLRATGETMARWGVSCPGLSPWRSTLAEAQRSAGELDAARSLAHEGVELARAFGAERTLGIALLAQARCEAGSAALELLEEAVKVLEGSGARLKQARALHALGAALVAPIAAPLRVSTCSTPWTSRTAAARRRSNGSFARSWRPSARGPAGRSSPDPMRSPPERPASPRWPPRG